jgi:hypothetical protein
LDSNIFSLQLKLKKSNLIKTLQNNNKKAISVIFGKNVRNLSKDEISYLKSKGNNASNWNKIFVSNNFSLKNISGNMFVGTCIIGSLTKNNVFFENSNFPSGIYNSIIINSEIGNNCLIYYSSINNYVVKDDTVIFQVGVIEFEKDSCCGNGTKIPIGIESGGREIELYAELLLNEAQRVLIDKRNKSYQIKYSNFINKYSSLVKSHFGIISQQNTISNVKRISNAFIGENSIIKDVISIDNSSILSNSLEKTTISSGSIIKNSCIQWGCEVSDLAIVENSLLMEHSNVSHHATVKNSIIGPNSSIEKGEITSCFVGPFTSMHHQSMLISTLWPDGRGNVAYGANIGSNHTSRAPDQEMFCGEGIFFGLSCSVKFPANLIEAPYTIIAAEVTIPSQQIKYPFSLINKPSLLKDNFPSYYNEIFPAWVLYNNIYSILRNEQKFKMRNKAQRNLFDLNIFKPSVVDYMISACNYLKEIKNKKDFYTSSDIKGLGENIISERSRLRAIETYEFYIEYYCLNGLFNQLLQAKDFKNICNKKSKNIIWEHQRELLNKNGYAIRSIKENLIRFIDIQEKIYTDLLRCKKTDDIRGKWIIDDYEATHCMAEDDPFIKNFFNEFENKKKNIKSLLSKL